jgi:TolB protein
VKYILLVLLSINLFAVDASIKIVTNVEHRTKIAIEDGSSSVNSKFFKTLLSDFKISGHFLADTKHNKADTNSNFISPALKNKEYILKYNLQQASGSKLTIRLLQSPSGTEVFKKSYAIPTTSKVPF